MEILIKEATLRDFIDIYSKKLQEGYSKERLETDLKVLIRSHKVWNKFPQSKPEDKAYHQVILASGSITTARFNGLSWLSKESKKFNAQVTFWARNIELLEPEVRQKV